MSENLLQNWGNVLNTSFDNLWSSVIAFIPNVAVAVIIFVIGWIIASILGKSVASIIKSLQLDKVLQNVGLEELVERAGFHLNVGAFLGGLVKWFIIFVFLTASTDVLKLTEVNAFIFSVLNYIPQIVVASLILIIAAVIADAVYKVITGSAKAVGHTSSSFFGGVAKWAIWITAIFTALAQLKVGPEILNELFRGLMLALSIGVGLSFGLGGKEAAAGFIEKLREDINGRK